MNISVVMSMLVVRNVKQMEFVIFSLNLCDRHAHFKEEEVPLSMNMSLNKMVSERIVCIIIPPFEKYHDGEHLHTLNPDVVHYCKVRCQACRYFCQKPIYGSSFTLVYIIQFMEN
jgi:hypothetical protein